MARVIRRPDSDVSHQLVGYYQAGQEARYDTLCGLTFHLPSRAWRGGDVTCQPCRAALATVKPHIDARVEKR